MIFFIILIVTIVLTWKFADWRNWQKYQPTMLLFALGNLFYNYVYHDRFLWLYNPKILNSHIVELIFTFTVLPLTALIFLSNFPENRRNQFSHILKYIIIFILVEYFLYKIDNFKYDFGWNIWFSLAWDAIMFFILAVHHRRPLQAYGLCSLVIVLMDLIFPFKLD